MRFEFPKTRRLLKSKEFSDVFDKGVKAVTELLVVFAAPSLQDRMGIIVSKKVGNAVVRNKVKRLLREHYRQLKQNHDESIELVVIARQSTKRAKASEIATSFEKSLTKLEGLLHQRKFEAL